MRIDASISPFLRRLLAHHLPDDFAQTAVILSLLSQRLPLDEFSASQWRLGQRYFRERIANLGLSGNLLLDLGCGTGNWSIAAASFFEQVVGFDSRSDRLDCATEISSQLRIHNTSFVCHDITSIPYADQTADCVIVYNVLPYVPNWTNVIDEAYRVLKPGGTLFCSWQEIGVALFALAEGIFLGRIARLRALVAAARSYRRQCNGLYLKKSDVALALESAGFTVPAMPPTKSAPLFPPTYVGLPFFSEIVAMRTAKDSTSEKSDMSQKHRAEIPR